MINQSYFLIQKMGTSGPSKNQKFSKNLQIEKNIEINTPSTKKKIVVKLILL